MLEKLMPMDEALGSEAFVKDEVPYNLLHLIAASPETAGYKSPDGRMIFAMSSRSNAWLWMVGPMADVEREQLLRELVCELGEMELPGVTGEPEVAGPFARLYAEDRKRSWRRNMTMEAYHAPVLQRPANVTGELRRAVASDTELVARYLAGFAADAYSVITRVEDHKEGAERLIKQGGMHVWVVEGAPVSMANIAHRSPRHGRLNAVYTPREERRKGYASALVAELGLLLIREGLTPMLYADQANPDSNRVYRNIGFAGCGTIAAFAFAPGN